MDPADGSSRADNGRSACLPLMDCGGEVRDLPRTQRFLINFFNYVFLLINRVFVWSPS